MGEVTEFAAGGNLNITATNTGGAASYNLKANGVSINTNTTSSYAFNHTNITTNTSYELEVTLGVTTSMYLVPAIKQEVHAVGMDFSLCLKASNFWHCGMYAVALNAVIPTWIIPRLMLIPVIPDLEFWFDYEEDSPFKLSFIF